MYPLVSIVVPVYNAEEYLPECLNSLLSQKYNNLEIICVDDGSDDSSLKILDSFRTKDGRVRVFSQNHKFAGSARNLGLAKAKGKYIIFVDSDDIFEQNMISCLVTSAERKKAEIIVFGYYTFESNLKERKKVRFPRAPKRVLSSADISNKVFQIGSGVPWNKFLLTDFVRNTKLQYQSIFKNNDEFFNRMILAASDRIVFKRKRFVNYRINNEYSLQGRKHKGILCFSDVITSLHTELINRGMLDKYKNSFGNYVFEVCYNALKFCVDIEAFEKILDELSSNTLKDIPLELFTDDQKQLISMLKNDSVADAMFAIIQYQNATMVSKKSIEYRIGDFLTGFIK